MNDTPETTTTTTPTPSTVEAPVESAPEAVATPVVTEAPVSSEAAAEPQEPKAEKKRGSNKPARKIMTNRERKADWRERLLSTKIIKSELFINALCDYALTHGGYNARRSWGNVLVRMHEHLVYRLRNRLETLSPNDMEYISRRLMGFLADKPLGEGPIAWNTNFPDNFTQRTEVDKYFGCNNKKLRDIAPQDRILLAFRDAAWPSRLEEEKGIGGSFAERYHYLVVSVVKFMTTGQEYIDGMFEGCYHSMPTDEYQEWQRKVQEKYDAKFGNRRANNRPRWIGADGKCTECGSDIIKDAQGHDICSNALCDHNIAPVSDSMAGFGRKASRQDARDFQPLPSGGGKRDGKDRRHKSDDADNEMQIGRKPKKHGKRFRVREDDEETGGVYGGGSNGGRTVVASGTSEGFGSLGSAFDNVKV